MFAHDRARWLTPKNLLIAFPACHAESAMLGFLMWNDVQASRQPIFTLPPVTQEKGKP